jgi:hypothetical protein
VRDLPEQKGVLLEEPEYLGPHTLCRAACKRLPTLGEALFEERDSVHGQLAILSREGIGELPSTCRPGEGLKPRIGGFFWWEIDISYAVLKLLSWTGLVWDLRLPPEAVLAANRIDDDHPDLGMLALKELVARLSG